LPEDEERWADLTVMFATANGYVRRNALSDFTDVRANGKIAMKFEGEDADDRLIAVATCTDADDVLLATRRSKARIRDSKELKEAKPRFVGRAIRFPVEDVRVFSGRSSVGVRGIQLEPGDAVISMSILRHVELPPETRNAYLKLAAKRRREMGEESEVAADQPQQEELPEESFEENGMGGAAETSISEEQFAYYAEREEFVLSVTEKGFGVRSSAYDYRITRRGGLGIENVALRANDAVIDAFPVGRNDQVILVTDTGMVIRVPVHDIRIVRRGKQGVVVFKVGDGERVVSVAHLPESDENGSGGNGSDASPADTPDTNET